MSKRVNWDWCKHLGPDADRLRALEDEIEDLDNRRLVRCGWREEIIDAAKARAKAAGDKVKPFNLFDTKATQ